MRLVAKKRCSKLRGVKKSGLRLSCGFLRAHNLDAHRDNGKRFAARSEEKLTAFLELESAIEGVGP
jgi:hypothetical protein